MQRKPSGIWWIVGGRRESVVEKDSDAVSVASTSSSVNKDLPSVPSDASAPSRPVPKKAMTWDFHSLKGFPKPKRSSTMSTVDTVSSVTTPPPSYTSTPGSSSGFFSTPASTPATTPASTPASTPGGSTSLSRPHPTAADRAPQQPRPSRTRRRGS